LLIQTLFTCVEASHLNKGMCKFVIAKRWKQSLFSWLLERLLQT